MSWIIDPDGYVSEFTGVIASIGAFGESTKLMEVTFVDGEEMLFPLARQFGGKWKYALGLAPEMSVSASWADNPDYVEGGSEPRAFFTFDYSK